VESRSIESHESMLHIIEHHCIEIDAFNEETEVVDKNCDDRYLVGYHQSWENPEVISFLPSFPAHIESYELMLHNTDTEGERSDTCSN